MSVTWNADANAHLRREAAARLLAVAVMFQTELRKRYNRANPAPHRTPAAKGEYPKARSGFLRDHILYQPTTVAAVMRDLTVRVGYGASAFYGVALINRGWKGVMDALAELRSQLESAAGSPTVTGVR